MTRCLGTFHAAAQQLVVRPALPTKRRATSDATPDGCIHQDNGIPIWIHPWAEVVNDARSSYEFFSDQLTIEASHSNGIETLKARYPHLFDGKGVRKGRGLAMSKVKASQ